MITVDTFIPSFTRIIFAIFISLLVAKRGYTKNSLDKSGALLAVFVGIVITLASYAFCACLLAFFVTSSILTKWKSERKMKVEENFKEGGQRNAVQVFCNGGIGVLISVIYISEVGFTEQPVDFHNNFTASVLITSFIGTFACCTGDTWSSEIGSAIGSDSPRLITDFRRVPIGTNGAITVVGTLASALGGCVIGVTYIVLVRLCSLFLLFDAYPPQWPVIVIASCAGFFGSVADSFLGAHLQYSGFCLLRKKVVSEQSTTTKHICGRHVLNNHQVNLLSSLILAVVTPYLSYKLWPYFL